jgi:hypothetical protein
VSGWRMLFGAFVLVILAFILNRFAEPVIYGFYPPTPTLTATSTITQTPTITLTPSITLTPTITSTPSVTNTPTPSPTPHIPLAIEIQFTSVVTPNPSAVFSPLQFAQALDDNFVPINPAIVFQNPVGHLYAQFTYDGMLVGAQWTAIWYRGNELVHYETAPWDGGTGGIGYSDWDPPPYEWQPGEYEVQVFVGHQWKVVGIFTVEGDAPTPPPSPTPTFTVTPTPTSTSTRTPRPTVTATFTPGPTLTRTITPLVSSTPGRATNTPVPTKTKAPTFPPTVTFTHMPTQTATTPTPTSTHAPTYTPTPPTPTNTHQPTNTPRP